MTRELSAPIATTTYFMEASQEMATVLEDQDGVMHACEAETSMMTVAPELVDTSRLSEAHGPSFDIAASLRPTLKRFILFDQLTASGVAGDARRSSSTEGQALLAACARALSIRLKAGEPWL